MLAAMSDLATSTPIYAGGRWYRSRLDARWARFFDLLGWHYEYEPCDFDEWTPTFVLCEAMPVFVEVAPTTTFPQDLAERIDLMSCMDEVLIVGLCLPHPDEWNDAHPCVGWLREVMRPERYVCEFSWGLAPFGVWDPDYPWQTPRVGFCHEVQSFRDRVTGIYEGGCWGGRDLDTAALYHRWGQAQRQTQWPMREGAFLP